MKVNGQWLYVDGVVDTGSNPHELCYAVIPVDFDTEYKRYEREYFASDEYKNHMAYMDEAKKLFDRFSAGELTYLEYEMLSNPHMTEEQIKQGYKDSGIEVDWDSYWKE